MRLADTWSTRKVAVKEASASLTQPDCKWGPYMMKWTEYQRKTVAALAAAWRLAGRFPVPPSDSGLADEADPQWILRMLPALGCLIGLSLWLLAALLGSLLAHAAVAAVCAALLAPAWHWWLTRAKGPVGLIHTAANWLSLQTDGNEAVAAYVPLIVMNAMILLKALGFGILVYLRLNAWLIVVPMLGLTAFAQGTLGRQLPDDRQSQAHWFIAAAVAAVIGAVMGNLVAGLFAAVAAWLATPALGMWAARRSGAAAVHREQALIEVVELMVLWIGVLAA